MFLKTLLVCLSMKNLARVFLEAKKRGYTFAMPVEKSGQDEFDFEYGATLVSIFKSLTRRW